MNYFLEPYPLGHLIIALIEVLILLFAYPFFRISNNQAMIVLPIVLVSTIYDNAILFSGKLIGEGNLLETLSLWRFFLHYATIPFFIVVAIELAHRSEAIWANKVVRVLSWLIALGLAGFDITRNFVGLELVPVTFAGVLRYLSAQTSIPITTISVNIFVLLVAIGIWIRTKNWFWLFIGATIALVGNALPSQQLGSLPSSASECVLALSLLLTQYHFEDVPEPDKPVTCPVGWKQTKYSGYQICSKEKETYTIYQTGSHRNGDFVRIYVPKKPCQEDGKFKVITYLHGFALCLPDFYRAHLEHLATEGYYVFFPDYQRSDYPDFTKQDREEISQAGETEISEGYEAERVSLRYWLKLTGLFIYTLIFRREIKKRELRESVASKSIFEGLRLAVSRLFFIRIASAFYLFNREFGKNLISMITTVIESLRYSPEEWLGFSIDSTVTAWEKLCEHSKQEQIQELDLSPEKVDFYVFGHSLGGLLALSWSYGIKKKNDQKYQDFHPKQVVTGDPAPNTALGIPKIALVILGFFGFPFATQKMDIKDTGKDLKVPVGILHGNNDKIVPPKEWFDPNLPKDKNAFFKIASPEKKIYFSLSNEKEHLTANHNQSVTCTSYYGDVFMHEFGGMKQGPNAYNYEYIWPALDAVVENKVKANELENKKGFCLKDIKVSDKPIESH